jgi:hypothetical protein
MSPVFAHSATLRASYSLPPVSLLGSNAAKNSATSSTSIVTSAAPKLPSIILLTSVKMGIA